MSVREFVTTFRGLSSSAKGKKILAETGMARTNLADLASGSFDSAAIACLLEAMQRESRPVKPAQLGVIGREHLAARVEAIEAEIESFTYKKVAGEADGQPYVLETAFAWCPDLGTRRLVTGVNWSPGITDQFRHLGQTGRSLDALLERQRADEDTVLVMHLACPVAAYADRGKSAVILSWDLAGAVSSAVESVTAKWAKQRKAEERNARARARRRDAMTRAQRWTIKDAAWHCMEAAYMKASANNTLPANARQIMYAARPTILSLTGNDELDDGYFTQTLLPDYIAEHGLEDAWDVAYDARGHLIEPHTRKEVPLGTLQVRDYLARAPEDPTRAPALKLDYPTAGPGHRYQQILFIEKEGFLPLLEHERIAERYDLAIMSTKGMSVVAARSLVDQLRGRVRLFVAHDFDKSGLSITATLTGDTRRYRFGGSVDVVDLGISLTDVRRYGLEAEPVHYRGSEWKVKANLRQNGATPEEIEFLLHHRVELNAFPSDQFIEWLTAKLEQHGARKVIPGSHTLETAYKRASLRHTINAKIAELSAALHKETTQIQVPGDLRRQVEEKLVENPELSWDGAVAEIISEEAA